MNISSFSEFIISWWSLVILKCLFYYVRNTVNPVYSAWKAFVTVYGSARTVIQKTEVRKNFINGGIIMT